uniref:Uncharacterized protein n=1 Tax=Rhizophagus irregularis (strain DAOM 181602 / DAOM 197198 / MUCL 43194) TaxID=747089 RepID=U9UCW9_RHIID
MQQAKEISPAVIQNALFVDYTNLQMLMSLRLCNNKLGKNNAKMCRSLSVSFI